MSERPYIDLGVYVEKPHIKFVMWGSDDGVDALCENCGAAPETARERGRLFFEWLAENTLVSFYDGFMGAALKSLTDEPLPTKAKLPLLPPVCVCGCDYDSHGRDGNYCAFHPRCAFFYEDKSSEWYKTIEEWGDITGIRVLDPDGFDRRDPYLYKRRFSRAAFDEGVVRSTCLRERDRAR